MSDRKVLEVKLVSLGDGDGISERRVLLAAGQDVIIGRASSNRGVAASADNTKISNPVISKEHAAFTTDAAAATVFIKDLRSMHGTRVDDRELSQGEKCAIFSGSILQFGSPVIRGNATYKPAKYIFSVEPINPTNGFSGTMPTTTAVPTTLDLSDTKKGYGDDSSLYSSDDYDSQEEDFMSNEDADVTMIPDTYPSEQESDASPDESVHSSSDDSADESEGSDDMSVEEYCSTELFYPTTDAQAETSSTAAVRAESFSSSYLDESELLDGRVSSVQPAGPTLGLDIGMTTGEWTDYSEADQSAYLTSTPAAWTSETADSFAFAMEKEEAQQTNKLQFFSGSQSKPRPFSNSINELCEPAPKVDATVPEVDETTENNTTKDTPAPETGTSTSPDDVDTAMTEDTRFFDETLASLELNEGSKAETTRLKRSAAEAELDTEPSSDAVGSIKAAQIATPEQMSNRRIASITQRARDFSIGAVVGGVALFTVLASMGDAA